MISPVPRLNADETKVLAGLASAANNDEFAFLTFRAIARRSRLNRASIRRACRSLARKGLAKFGKGLWTEDGEPYGSGYAVTRKGAAYADLKLINKYVLKAWN